MFEVKDYLAMLEIAGPNEQGILRKSLSTRTRVKCCGDIPLPWLRLFDSPLALKYETEVWQPTAPNATYCSYPHCNIFLKPQTAAQQNIITCPHCSTQTCTRCKDAAHPGKSCNEDPERAMLVELARERKWMGCPLYGLIVERSFGCRRMLCPRCRVEYCYKCGRGWRECFGGSGGGGEAVRAAVYGLCGLEWSGGVTGCLRGWCSLVCRVLL
ncbi:hypothetical protein Q9189_007514 [Teloschistes chrysophthalmus]